MTFIKERYKGLWVFFLFLFLDEDDGSRREEVPAADFGSAEEGAHHLPGQPEETVQTVQRKNQRGDLSFLSLYSQQARWG